MIWPAAILAVGLALAGCSSSGGGSADSSVAHVPQPAQAGDSGGSATGSLTDGKGGTSTVIDSNTQRQVITTGTAEILTAHPVSAGDKAAHIAENAGGRVDDRTQSAATRHTPGTATLTLRIPSAGLTDALDQLKKLGTVRTLKLTTEDVTTKSQDLGARITALKTTVARLLALETRAKTTADLLAIETDLSDRQADLDSLTTQQKYLGDQVAMSTITIHFVSPVVAAKAPPAPSPANAFTAGLAGFGVFFTWVFLVLSYLLPWLALAAVLTLGTIYLVRWRRRRRPTPAA
jgi:hypothetical protein